MDFKSFAVCLSSDWVRYSNYEYRDIDGERYIKPTDEATPGIFNPLDVAGSMIVDALNIGALAIDEEPPKDKIEELILAFAKSYGLLGFMTALPLNERFLGETWVYFAENAIIKKEKLKTKDYLELFLLFDEDLEIVKNNKEIGIQTSSLPMTMFMDKPIVYDIVFSKSYCEKLDWLIEYFKSLYSHLGACTFYGKTDNQSLKTVYNVLIERHKIKGLTVSLKMLQRPTMVWDFNSLKTAIDMIYCVYVSDDVNPLRICKHCGKVLLSSNSKTEFCSPQCRNQFNVYKSRGKG